MAKIIDPDSLVQATNIVFDTTAKTIALTIAGDLSTDGVSLKALYSFTKEEWRTDAALIKFPFPFVPITDEQFELQNGWNFANATTRNLIRDAGWAVKNVSGNTTEEWAGIIGLGTIESDDQLYYEQGAGAVDVVLTGQVNQAVQILSDPNGDGNYTDGYDRRSTFTLFVREQGQVFGQSSLADIGVTTMASQAYRFPISTANDLKITATDTAIGANAPYTGMSITYYSAAQVRSIGGTNRNFGIIIDGNGGTAEQIYEFVQKELRDAGDIDADASTLVGKTADELLVFAGETLKTLNAANVDGGGTGVYIDDFSAADTNRLTFNDNTGAERTFPFVASLTLNFSNTLQNDSSAIYRVFFTDANGDEFGTADAILVDDNDDADISGTVGGVAALSFTFDYDGNVQGGRTAGTDADITVVAIGLDTGQYVVATGTIARSNANTVSLVSPLERNYSNPA
jgi:hypothetical protein